MDIADADAPSPTNGQPETPIPAVTLSPPPAPKNGSARPAVEVRPVTSEIAAEIAEFFRAVGWDDDATAASVARARETAAASNPVTPGEAPPAYAFLARGKVLGYLGTLPVRFWNGREEAVAHWLKGLMVLPEQRNGPVGFALVKEVVKAIGPAGSIAAAPAARRLFTALGFTETGPVTNYLAILRPAPIAARIDLDALGLAVPRPVAGLVKLMQRTRIAIPGGWLAGGALRLWRAAHAPGRSFSTASSEVLPSIKELDALWLRTRATLAAAPVRDGRFLAWRYPTRGEALYRAVTARRVDGTLAGIAFIRRPRPSADDRLRGIAVATLSDIVFPADEPNVGRALLAASDRAARTLGAEALLCSATHPAVTSLLPGRGYVRIPANIHFLVRDPDHALGLPGAASAWWVTRGDGFSDEAL